MSTVDAVENEDAFGLFGDGVTSSVDEYRDARVRRDETVWASEVLAQDYERTIVALWDELLEQERLTNPNKMTVLREFPIGALNLGALQKIETLPWGISRHVVSPDTASALSEAEWKALITRLTNEGYRLVQSEWHHAGFATGADGVATSDVNFELHVLNARIPRRVVVKGTLVIRWMGKKRETGLHIPMDVDATQVEVYVRDGDPAFAKAFEFDPAHELGQPLGVHPLMLHDMDGDGRSEIMLGWCNTRLRTNEDWTFERTKLFDHPSEIHETGLTADVDGDGFADCVLVSQAGDLIIFKGTDQGGFSKPPIGKTRNGGPLRQPSSISCGDIDGDGDLDLWLTQYRISYLHGNMPEPYYDANDGFPSYLLINDGNGRFMPANELAGLTSKQHRRSYTSCLIDLDDDSDLDLLVISDFAGVDVYANKGDGTFKDVTDAIVDERHLFGMSGAFGDYNLDGRLDFFVAGMSSTTARRLERMGAGREDRPDMQEMRMKMAYGNRMYVNDGDRYVAPQFADQAARTGWSWGIANLDFDNDGDVDIFVANGHQSGKSTKDHCTHFWCHDIYDGKSENDNALDELFKEVHAGYINQDESWDGYQKNALLMNLGGEGMVNVAFLMGVADAFDARAAVADDLDGDGRVDLLVTEDDSPRKQVLHVYRNQMESDHNWIGVRLNRQSGRSPIGARILVKTAQQDYVDCITVGESLYSQQCNTRHFGLGGNDEVTAIEVRWPNGEVSRTDQPNINQYHTY